jgi:hypothetical protein
MVSDTGTGTSGSVAISQYIYHKISLASAVVADAQEDIQKKG